MENLKILESKLAERSRREEELKSELKEVQDEINVLEVEIARIRGTPEELNDIRKESENFTKDKKKRPRPNYKENFNKEHEERTTKRQKRNKISSEIIQDKEMEDTSESEMDTIEEETMEQEENTKLSEEMDKEFMEKSQEYGKSNRGRQSKKEIEDLLEEISEEELKNLEFEKGINKEKITEEISRLYYKLCKQEGILFEGKRGTMEIYYEFEKRFEEKINILLEEYQKEKTAINKIIEEIIGGGINHDRRNIIRKSEKARKIYRIISVDGGKEKIRRLKFLNSEDYMKFNFGEIEEWIKNH